MKKKQSPQPEFNFKKCWSSLSEAPYPDQKVFFRMAILEASKRRHEYLNNFRILKTEVDSSTPLLFCITQHKTSHLLQVLSLLWDIYSVYPYSLRQRQKLDRLIKQVEEEYDFMSLFTRSLFDDKSLTVRN